VFCGAKVWFNPLLLQTFNPKSTNRPMNTDEINQKLVEEISKTELLIKEYQELTKPVAPDVAIERISRMNAINNKSVAETALRQAIQPG
jgi:hypothetical protein